MDKSQFLQQYHDLMAQPLPEEQRNANIAALKREYAGTFADKNGEIVQPGDRVRLTWRNGDSDTVGLKKLRINVSNGSITPVFGSALRGRALDQDRYDLQRGYTMELLDTAYFPDFVEADEETTDTPEDQEYEPTPGHAGEEGIDYTDGQVPPITGIDTTIDGDEDPGDDLDNDGQLDPEETGDDLDPDPDVDDIDDSEPDSDDQDDDDFDPDAVDDVDDNPADEPTEDQAVDPENR